MYGIAPKRHWFYYECASCGCSRLYEHVKPSGGGRRRRYCSKECQRVGIKRLRESLAILVKENCASCGDQFFYPQGQRRPKYCSERCVGFARRQTDSFKEAHKRWKARNPESIKTWQSKNRHSRRAAVGQLSETISPTELFERDKWRCQLCGCKVHPCATYHPQRATMDHIIPLSRGGGHIWSNLQTACNLCNSKKNSKAAGQIRLF